MKLNIVPARTGWLWVRLGLRTFRRQPLALAGLFFMYITTISLTSLVPLVGNVLALALLPAATLGLMAATREAEQGNFPMPSILLSAFRAGRHRARAMALLGLLYAGAFLLLLGATALLDGGTFARFYLMGGALTREVIESATFQQAVWLAMALYLPLSLLFWHAPALVHWHEIPPVKSLFFSAVACVRNFGAMTIFALGWMAIFTGVGILLTLVTILLGQPGMIGTLMLPTLLLLAAIFFTSIWFSFRDCFAD
ncbi:MAG: BPSS1780 family membrane protein [Hylemonella sp.]